MKAHPVIFRFGISAICVLGLILAGLAAREEVGSLYHRLREAMFWEVPLTFSNARDKGMVGERNMLTVSIADLELANQRQITGTDTTVRFLFPFVLPAGRTLTYTRKSLLRDLVQPEAVPSEDRARQAEAIQEQEAMRRAGIKNEFEFVLPPDTLIIAPADGQVVVFKSSSEPDLAMGLNFFVYDKDADLTYKFWLFASGSTSDSGTFVPLVTTQDIKTPTLGTDWQALPSTMRGTKLGRTNHQESFLLVLLAFKGKSVLPGITSGDIPSSRGRLLPLTGQFITEADTAGNEKLVVINR